MLVSLSQAEFETYDAGAKTFCFTIRDDESDSMIVVSVVKHIILLRKYMHCFHHLKSIHTSVIRAMNVSLPSKYNWTKIRTTSLLY